MVQQIVYVLKKQPIGSHTGSVDQIVMVNRKFSGNDIQFGSRMMLVASTQMRQLYHAQHLAPTHQNETTQTRTRSHMCARRRKLEEVPVVSAVP